MKTNNAFLEREEIKLLLLLYEFPDKKFTVEDILQTTSNEILRSLLNKEYIKSYNAKVDPVELTPKGKGLLQNWFFQIREYQKQEEYNKKTLRKANITIIIAFLTLIIATLSLIFSLFS